MYIKYMQIQSLGNPQAPAVPHSTQNALGACNPSDTCPEHRAGNIVSMPGASVVPPLLTLRSLAAPPLTARSTGCHHHLDTTGTTGSGTPLYT